MPDPNEVATLVVAGHYFDDFESIWVQHRWADGWPLFRFSSADVIETPPDWTKLQFKPGDQCAIYLGGHLALNGFILSRQTAYDATSHGVQLSGVGLTWAAARASILDKKSSYDGMTFEQVARKVLAPTGIQPEVIGVLDATPFVQLSNNPGETIWDFLERIARPRGIVLGSNPYGNFLLIGDHAFTPVQQLIEGQNILKCNAIISIENTRSDFRVRGSSGATDGHSGTKASEQEGSAPGSLPRYSPLLVPAEQPVWNAAELQTRAEHEAVWNEGTIVTATIIVQGWFRSQGALWAAGDKVYVRSPMAMLDMELKIITATFTQDRNSGTLTQLDLVAPWLLKDKGRFNLGRAGAPQEPGKGAVNTKPAETPPAGQPSTPPPSILPNTLKHF